MPKVFWNSWEIGEVVTIYTQFLNVMWLCYCSTASEYRICQFGLWAEKWLLTKWCCFISPSLTSRAGGILRPLWVWVQGHASPRKPCHSEGFLLVSPGCLHVRNIILVCHWKCSYSYLLGRCGVTVWNYELYLVIFFIRNGISFLWKLALTEEKIKCPSST